MSMNAFRRLVLVLVFASLSACGFALRGSGGTYSMPFKTIYLGFPDTSSLGTELRRNLRGGDRVEVVTDIRQAQARFEVVSENRSKSILSLNAQGRVREYLLNYTLVFRVLDSKGDELLEATEISLKRPLTFNETQVLAKEQEEALLYRDMQADLVQKVMRRLAAVRPTGT